MRQFIAPQMLTVNGEPSPCKCIEGSTCAYCVQANLILWERKEHPEQIVKDRLLKIVAKTGPRKTARLLGVQPSTVTRWLKKKGIPDQYSIEIQRVLEVVA